MKIINCEQLSPEWFEARRGIPTASNFDKIITTKGLPSKSKQKLMYRLAGEKVSGISEESFQSAAMLRGIEVEAEAASLYEVVKDVKIEKVGFCLSDVGYGASPDGLVENEGMVEIKCPIISTHVGYLLDEKLPTDYFQQVQGQLFVADRLWCDFVSYYPGLKPIIIRVVRDETFIKALRVELELFCQELNEVVEKIK